MNNPIENTAASEMFDEARFIGSLTGRKALASGLSATQNPRRTPIPDGAVVSKERDYDRVLAERDAACARAALLEEQFFARLEGEAPDEQTALERDWLEFIEAHPEMRDPLSELPEEVWQQIEEGKSPCAAFLSHENRRLAARAEALQQALDAATRGEQARAKSPGSVRSMATPASSGDPFLEGLMQGFSR